MRAGNVRRIKFFTAGSIAIVILLRNTSDSHKNVAVPAVLCLGSSCAKKTPDPSGRLEKHSRISFAKVRSPFIHKGRSLSYGQLQYEAGRIAQALMAAGIWPGSLVAIYLHRSPLLLEALLGTWQAGATYLPLDPTHPNDRNSFMVEDADVDFVLTETDLLPSAPRGSAKLLNLDSLLANALQFPTAMMPVHDPESLAHVIYTSGSTGRPKGVKISHALDHYGRQKRASAPPQKRSHPE